MSKKCKRLRITTQDPQLQQGGNSNHNGSSSNINQGTEDTNQEQNMTLSNNVASRNDQIHHQVQSTTDAAPGGPTRTRHNQSGGPTRTHHNQSGGPTRTRHNQSDANRLYEYNVLGPNGEKCRGKTVLADIWNLPKGHRIVVEVNEFGQPIGVESQVLGGFCGTIARNGGLCSLSYTRWNVLKEGNKGNNQVMILKEVEERFIYPKALEYWILKSIGAKWRDHKCSLKGQHYSETDPISVVHDACPENVVSDQWISLVNFWRSDEGKKRCENSKKSLKKAAAKIRPVSTTGTKSHARVAEELEKLYRRPPTRAELYLKCHKHKKKADITAKISKVECGGGFYQADEDVVTKVLGKDKYGRVRGLGLGVTPSKFWSKSAYSRSYKGLNMTSKDETVSEYLLRKVKEQMDTVVQCLQRQDKIITKQGDTIGKLKRKLREYTDDSELDDSSSEDEYSIGSVTYSEATDKSAGTQDDFHETTNYEIVMMPTSLNADESNLNLLPNMSSKQ